MTGRVIPLNGDRHRQIQALLPWYAGGRLTEVDRSEVELHLGACAECQAELGRERRLLGAMAEADPIAGLPLPDVDAGWAAMRAAVGQERRRRWAGAVAALFRRRGEPALGASSGPRWLPWAVAAQSCAALALVAVLGLVVWRGVQPPLYRTLGAPARAEPGNVVVIFKPETTEAELRAILRDSHARLVGGPTAADAYLIRAPGADRPAVLKGLRARPQVVLAEPIDARGPE